MRSIKIKAPAKINLTLEVLGKRPDDYHNIKSIMQSVSLFDYINISIENVDIYSNEIEISGNNPLIPYDKTNLAYISAEKFTELAGIKGKKIKISIEKNIPVAAGLAGGSADAAATLLGLNILFDNIFTDEILSELASGIGADVNFCLHGGTQVASSKGELLNKIVTPDLNIVIIKPKDLFISAKEAYTRFSQLSDKPATGNTENMIEAIRQNNNEKIAPLISNHLEDAILPFYPVIKSIKTKLIQSGCINALMSGSGPSVYGIYSGTINLSEFLGEFEVFKVKTVSYGVIPE